MGQWVATPTPPPNRWLGRTVIYGGALYARAIRDWRGVPVPNKMYPAHSLIRITEDYYVISEEEALRQLLAND